MQTTGQIIPASHLPAEEYHAREEISGSDVNACYGKTPAFVRWYLETGRKVQRKSAALELGTLLHLATLEPERFDALVTEGPINPKTNEPYGRTTKAWEAWEAENPDAIALSKDDAAKVRGMGQAIREHPAAWSLLRRDGENEVSCFWTDAETGVRCRGRIDKYAVGFALVDLKSSRSVDPRWFEKEAYIRGYHRKAGMYEHGWAQLTGQHEFFAFPVVQSSPPFEVCVFNYSPDAVAQGLEESREVLNTIRKCREAREWPSYPQTVQTLELPFWARRNPTDQGRRNHDDRNAASIERDGNPTSGRGDEWSDPDPFAAAPLPGDEPLNFAPLFRDERADG